MLIILYTPKMMAIFENYSPSPNVLNNINREAYGIVKSVALTEHNR